MWTAPVDLYCERTSAAFWAEPLNAVTNAAFLVAAAAVLIEARRAPVRDVPVMVLAGVVAAIGVGSFLFHTVAERWAGLADVLPIAGFVLGYLVLALRRFLGLGPAGTLLGVGLLVAVTAVLPRLVAPASPVLAGSLGYVPALVALVVVGLLLRWRAAHAAAWLAAPKNRAYGAAADPVRRAAEASAIARWRAAGAGLLAAAGLFAVSLTARTLDMAVCAAWPLGTHALWHLLNAAALHRLLVTALRHAPPTKPAESPGGP
ncbi:ceramidase domain-containing protein [Blastochloris sulfoviridis]|uniref:Ceramidase n=1 Tax=Blastochloris sulfoviridis TaxID=50712 RepID=A0A5M6HKA1_9HYPH|nr:ceramidase domain-containing protein [Blastochloris sulfoviridis]KAA5596254.1 hypothetical protein F1193_15750 [Blastochloris sulfoviridis]